MRRSSLVVPALLVALATTGVACSAETPRSSLASSFPGHASAALGLASGVSPSRDARGYVLAAGASAPTRSFTVELPDDGARPVAMHLLHLDLEVREAGEPARAKLVANAIAYARAGVTSYWSAAPGGVEEWLHFERGVIARGRAAAAWRVAGGALRARGDAIAIEDARGFSRALVTAPEAFAASGARVGVRLAARGDTIELFVDTDGAEVLVDPYWKSVAMLPVPRYDHAAARLPTGEVLVAGGYPGLGEGNPLGDAYTYDAKQDAWTQLPDMSIERQWPLATTLMDGTVMVTGGDRYGQPLATTEIYDPKAAAWTPEPDMPHSRERATATIVDDGRVLLAGGRSGGGCAGPGVIDFADVYDPTQSAWMPTDPMFDFRERHVAAKLADGTVLVAGGSNDFAPVTLNASMPVGLNVLATSEVWDPKTGHWTHAGPMTEPREDFQASLLADGTVLVEGGVNFPTGVLATAEIFDPKSGMWTAITSMSTRRENHTATVLADGRVLVAGGDDGTNSLSSAEIYDPKTQAWTSAPPMIDARASFTATRLLSGDVLVAGGFDLGQLATSEIFSTGCRDDNDCAGTEYCTPAKTCAPKKPDGSPATNTNECSSGIIADGVCCDKTCDAGPCDACTVKAGGTKDGTCSFTTASCDVTNTCAIGLCKMGACTPVNKIDGTPCTDGVCIAGACLADPHAITTSSSSSGGSTSSGASGATSSGGTTSSGQGGAGGGGTTDELTGGACAIDPRGDSRPDRAAIALGLALAALARRRRARP